MSIQNLFSDTKWNKASVRIQLTRIMQIFIILAFLFSAVGVNPVAAEGILQLVSATPNGTDAPISSIIEIEFNQPILPETFAGSINGQPMVPTQIVVKPGETQVSVDPGELEYGKTYAVLITGTVSAASGGATLGSDYSFSFTVATNTDSKHPTTTVNVPASSLEVGQQYTISGQASGYVWQRDPDNPLELELFGADGSLIGNSGMLHPTVIYFPQGIDGYKYWLIYTGTGGSVENPILMRSTDGVHFTSDGVTNPIFAYNFQPPYDTQNLADPEVYRVGNTWMLFYEQEALSSDVQPYMGSGGNIGVALSTDGKTWEPYGGAYTYDPANHPTDFPANGNPVVKPPTSTSTGYRSGEMAIIFKDGLYHMWRTVIDGGLFIDHDTATDPRGPWTLQPDKLNMGGYEYGPHPDVVYDAQRNLYLMLYLIPSGANVGQLGLYTSSSPSGPWTLHPINPLFSAQSAWEGSRLYRSAMVNVDGQWYLYYTGNATNNPQIGLAREVSGVRRVEVSTDGGSTWQNVSLNADGSWTYQWTPTQPGTFSVKARVIDDFMQGDPTSGISVSVGSGPLPTLQAPILVITDSSLASNPFNSYLTEILKAEGLTEFQQVELGSLMADAAPLEYLANFSVVLLAESTTNAAARQVLSDYVTGGGNLIAMRPDTAMADLFGLTYVNVRPELNLEFFAIDTSTEAGRGIYNGSLQYHGEADNYTLNGASALAYLWNSISSPSSNPAVTIKNVGAGSAVAFTFDLAKSIVMTRQGNPAWKDSEGDGMGGYRPMDTFQRSNGEWWISGNRMRIPQADEEQRFLANLILTLSDNPLPRMWYLPGEHNSVFISTGDAEGAGGTGLNPVMNDIATYGGRYTNYLMESGISATDPTVEAGWRAAGMEVGPHVDAADDCASLAPAYAQITSNILSKFSHPARTARSHTISWCGWTDMAEIEANNGTELDTNYYHYNNNFMQYGVNADGYFTGSGMPQRFMNEQGNLLSIYQAATQFPDEWFADNGRSASEVTATIENILDAAENGYYSAFVANIHHVRYDGVDPITHTWANNIWAYARDNDIPLWSAEDLLFFVKARNASRFENVEFGSSVLTFDFVPGAVRSDLSIMIPAVHEGNNLLSIQVDGENQTRHMVTVKGLDYARFAAPSTTAHIVATYGVDTVSPQISAVQATDVTDISANIEWQTDELASSQVNYGTDPANLDQTASVAGNTIAHVVPLSGLSPSTTYHYRVTSVDRTGNPPTVSDVFTFTTGAARWVETTSADFLDGTLDNTKVTTTAGGEVTLGSGSTTENFEGTSLDTNTWFAKNLLGGDPVVSVSGGQVTVSSGTYIRTNQSYFQKTVEGSMTFLGGQYAHFGWADTLQADDDGIPDPSWIMFSTLGTGIQARTRLGGIENNMPLSGVAAGVPHVFKIVWNTNNAIEFWVDGVLKASDTRNFTQPFRVYMFNTSADWVSILGDYASSGVYQSSVFDTGQASHFNSLTWMGATPNGTSAAFATRTSDDGTAWSDWLPLASGGAVDSPDGQFIQYQITLATSDTTVAPSIEQVAVTYEPAGPDTTPPAITNVTPASNATNVALNANVTIQFSEPIDTTTFQATINGASAFAATFQNGNRVAVLDPDANFAPASVVNVWISGSVEDRVGHTLGSPYQWSFTTSAQSPAWVETTTSDFSDGTLDNILISSTGDGELRLDQTSTTQETQTEFSDDFSGTVLNWDALGNPIDPRVDFHLDSGKLVHGTLGESYHPAIPKDFGATANFEFNVDVESPNSFWGLAWGLQDNAHYYMAQSFSGTFAVFRLDNFFSSYTQIGSFPAPAIVPGNPQHVRLIGDNGTYTIYINGALIGTLQDATYATGKVGVVGYGGWVTNFDNATFVATTTTVIPGGSGTYTSNEHDSGDVQVWGQLSWTGQNPTGTSVQFATRSSADHVTWSNWADVDGSGNIISPAGRFIQYRAQLASTEINLSPVVESVVVTSSVITNHAPLAAADTYNTDEGTALHVPIPGVLANDTDADSDPLTASKVSDPANGTLDLNADGSFTYTPDAGFVGEDTFTYQAHDAEADSNVATVTITVVSTAICVNPDGSGGCYASIQDAIDAASTGETITVAAGTYAERVILNKPLTLTGAGTGQSVIDASSFTTSGHVIDITALTGNTKIEGFEIRTGDHSNGIHASGGTDAAGKIEILNNHIIGTNFGSDQYGIIAGYGDVRKLIISGNEISNVYDNSVLVELQMGETEITNNTLNGPFPSIFFMTYDGQDVTTLQKVSGNTIDLSTAEVNSGVAAIGVNPATYYVSTDRRSGKYSNFEISNNSITGVNDLSFKGISIGENSTDGASGGFDDLRIFDNTISGTSGKGIQFFGHITGADVHDNTLTGLYQGLKGFTYESTFFPENNNIYHNEITDASDKLVFWIGSGIFEVEENWWGNSAGPDPAKMSPNVDYTPWCTDAACTTILEEVVLNAPSGVLTSWNHAFSWTGTSTADYYQLEVYDASDTQLYSQWFTNSICTGLNCAISPVETQNLANGDYKWKVRTYGVSGYGEWTPFTIFSLSAASVTLVSPGNTLTDWNNTFTWTGIEGADYYQIEVYDTSDAVVYSQWYTNSICTGLNCSVSPAETQNLANGDYKWKVRTYGAAGFTAWTALMNFSLNVSGVTLIAPNNTLTTWDNTFSWTGISAADYYQLEVYDASDVVVYSQWYTNSICTGLNCAVAPAETRNLTNGDYKWKVRTYGVTGFTAWTAFMDFTLDVAGVTLISPTDLLTIWDNTFNWTGIPGADYYQIEVYDAIDTVIYSQWYTSNICSDLDCLVSPTETRNLANGDYKWKVRTYGVTGFTPFTASMNFTLDAPAVGLVAPSGALTDWNNTFSWTGISGADYYQIEVYDANDTLLYSQWYTNSICTDLNCAVSPGETQNLANGDYKWKVRTYGVTGFTEWTAFINFNLSR